MVAIAVATGYFIFRYLIIQFMNMGTMAAKYVRSYIFKLVT